MSTNSTPGRTAENDQPVLLTIRQVMALTGISRSKIYCYLGSGRLPSVYVGASRRVFRGDLAVFLSTLSDQPEN